MIFFHWVLTLGPLLDHNTFPVHTIIVHHNTTSMSGFLYSCRIFILFLISCYWMIFFFGLYILQSNLLSRIIIFSLSPLVVGHVSHVYRRIGLITTLYYIVFNLSVTFLISRHLLARNNTYPMQFSFKFIYG